MAESIMSALTGGGGSGGAGSASLGTLKAQIGLDTRGLDTGMASVKSSLAQMKGWFGSLQGTLAGIGVGIGVTQVLRSITREGREFGHEMLEMRNAVRGNREEFALYSAEALRTGAATEWSATQTARSLDLLKRSGYEAAESIRQLPHVESLAEIAGKDLASTTDLVTSALAAMDMPLTDTRRLVDNVAFAHNNAKGEVTDYLEGILAAAPIARAYNYSLEEVVGMLMLLGQRSIVGAEAGTKLGMSYMRANEAADKFKYTSGDIIDLLQRMKAEGKTPADVMGAFGGPRFAKVALELQNGSEKVRQFQKDLLNAAGEAKRSETVLETGLGHLLERLGSGFSTLGVYVYQFFGSDLKQSVQKFYDWMSKHRDDIVGFAYAVAKAVKIVFGALEGPLTAIGGLITGIGHHWRGAAREAEESAARIGEAGEDARDSLQKVSDVDLSRPFTSSEKYMTRWKETMGNIAELASAVMRISTAAFEGFFETIWSGFESTGAQAKAFKTFMESIVKDGFLNPDVVESNWQALLATHKKGVSDFVNIQKNAANEIRSAVGDARGALQFRQPGDILAADRASAAGTGTYVGKLPASGAFQAGLAEAKRLAEGYAKEIQRDQEEAKKAAEEHRKLVDDTVKSLRELVDEEGATSDERMRRWDMLKGAMTEQLKLQDEVNKAAGIAPSIRGDLMAKSLRDIERIRTDIVTGSFAETEIPLRFDFKNLITGLKDATGEAKRLYLDFVSYQADATREAMDQAGLGSEQLGRLWENYYSSQIELIQDEARERRLTGLAAEAFVQKRIKDLLREERQVRLEHGDFMIGLQDRVAEGMTGAMETGFFSVMKGDFASFTDYVKSIWDSMLQYLSQSLAQSAMKWLSTKPGFDWLGTALNLGGAAVGGGSGSTGSTGMPPGGGPNQSWNAPIPMARGAIALRPVRAIIAEREPEAVIPLSQYRQMQESHARTGTGGETKLVSATFNVYPQDVTGFKATAPQIMRQYVRALSVANRRR